MTLAYILLGVYCVLTASLSAGQLAIDRSAATGEPTVLVARDFNSVDSFNRALRRTGDCLLGCQSCDFINCGFLLRRMPEELDWQAIPNIQYVGIIFNKNFQGRGQKDGGLAALWGSLPSGRVIKGVYLSGITGELSNSFLGAEKQLVLPRAAEKLLVQECDFEKTPVHLVVDEEMTGYGPTTTLQHVTIEDSVMALWLFCECEKLEFRGIGAFDNLRRYQAYQGCTCGGVAQCKPRELVFVGPDGREQKQILGGEGDARCRVGPTVKATVHREDAIMRGIQDLKVDVPAAEESRNGAVSQPNIYFERVTSNTDGVHLQIFGRRSLGEIRRELSNFHPSLARKIRRISFVGCSGAKDGFQGIFEQFPALRILRFQGGSLSYWDAVKWFPAGQINTLEFFDLDAVYWGYQTEIASLPKGIESIVTQRCAISPNAIFMVDGTCCSTVSEKDFSGALSALREENF